VAACYTINNAYVWFNRDEFMTKRKNTMHPGLAVVIGLFLACDFVLWIAFLLKGNDIALLHPKGLIAHEEFKLILISAAVLMAIAIPALFFFYFFAWKYRETNTKATYDPEGRHSKYLVFSIWAIPSLVMVIMAMIMWTSTHKLDPHTAIASNTKPLTIQVIAMRWKWLFIYPEQNIAAVNYVQIPTNTPVQFELTADEVPMSSFWIPHLSGQLYAMTGHVNTLNLIAGTAGDYPGSSAEINGAGFAAMKFMTHVGSRDDFDQWVHGTQASGPGLDTASYAKLLQPSENNAYAYYSSTELGLYNTVVNKYAGPNHNMNSETASETNTENE
jgi:cytochrome o ubiquinol oxidase subunit 2